MVVLSILMVLFLLTGMVLSGFINSRIEKSSYEKIALMESLSQKKIVELIWAGDYFFCRDTFSFQALLTRLSMGGDEVRKIFQLQQFLYMYIEQQACKERLGLTTLLVYAANGELLLSNGALYNDEMFVRIPGDDMKYRIKEDDHMYVDSQVESLLNVKILRDDLFYKRHVFGRTQFAKLYIEYQNIVLEMVSPLKGDKGQIIGWLVFRWDLSARLALFAEMSGVSIEMFPNKRIEGFGGIDGYWMVGERGHHLSFLNKYFFTSGVGYYRRIPIGSDWFLRVVYNSQEGIDARNMLFVTLGLGYFSLCVVVCMGSWKLISVLEYPLQELARFVTIVDDGNFYIELWEIEKRMHPKFYRIFGPIVQIFYRLNDANMLLAWKKSAYKKIIEQYQDIFQTMSIGVLVIRQKDRKFVFSNKMIEQYLVLSGWSIDDGYVSFEQLSELKGVFSQVIEQLNHPKKVCVFFDQCEWFSARQNAWFQCQPFHVTWEEEKAVLLMIQDITIEKTQTLQVQKRADSLRLQGGKSLESSSELFLGESEQIKKVYEKVAQYAEVGADVLLLGETGTGKDYMARTLYEIGTRQDGLFIPVNCAAISEQLFESELFGNEKGAFTGAIEKRVGLIREANGGILFLDEIGEIPIYLQGKLLRFLENRTVRPVGGTEQKVDVIVYAATNRRLDLDVAHGKMREDFYYRLLGMPVIEIPPLRERRQDIPIFIDHFLAQYGMFFRLFPINFRVVLFQHDWPGNVRQLQSTINHFVSSGGRSLGLNVQKTERSLQILLEHYEKELVTNMLLATQCNVSQAARILQIPRSTLARKIKKYSISPYIEK